jgi:hypothetical protein
MRRTTARRGAGWIAAAAVLSIFGAGCATGVDVPSGGGSGAAGQGGGGGSGTTTSGGAGGASGCAPGAIEACYDGPPPTQGVGVCHGGQRICLADGSGFGPCEGQVVPGTESCATAEDDDCDGEANEPAAGCACTPGLTEPCYEGDLETQDVGACHGGQRTCQPDGASFGPCEGQVLPALENCDTPGDDDCDGEVNEPSAGCGASSCDGCTASPAGVCASDAVVVGHYQGGNRTVCIGQGDGTPFELALMSYETTSWTLTGAVARVTQIQVYTVDPFGGITGNAGIPTSIQQGGSSPADPYTYSGSMGDCPAHTGYTGAVFGVPQASVCHMEIGLPSQCSYPSYSCLSISP